MAAAPVKVLDPYATGQRGDKFDFVAQARPHSRGWDRHAATRACCSRNSGTSNGRRAHAGRRMPSRPQRLFRLSQSACCSAGKVAAKNAGRSR